MGSKASVPKQTENIKLYKPLMIVGTPGRLAELSRAGVLHSHPCSIVVLDEVIICPLKGFRDLGFSQYVVDHIEALHMSYFLKPNLNHSIALQSQPCSTAVLSEEFHRMLHVLDVY